MSNAATRQPWINNARFDTAFLLLPPFLALLAVAALPAPFREGSGVPLAAWVIVVLCIDVAHVYSTLFRTYFDPSRFRTQRTLYISVPVLCYVAGVLLYAAGAWVFWRALAYVAVFHFIRQQYGFMRLYSRREATSRVERRIDAVTIYAATIYPILYWHLSPGRRFSWFMEGDFLQWNHPSLLRAAGFMYAAALLLYLIKELRALAAGRAFNIPRNGIILGTALSWYAGIVFFNGDLAFTLLNVISHGIPYMALVWFAAGSGTATRLPRWKGIMVFIGVILAAAWIEEGLWDRWVWGGEHVDVFAAFAALPALPAESLLLWVVPLLSLPQATHYVLDGFIWRRKDG